MRCRLAAPALAYWELLDELFAGTPSAMIVKLLLSVASKRDLAVMLPGVKCAFLHGSVRSKVYIELSRHGANSGVCRTAGKLNKNMFGEQRSGWGNEQAAGIGLRSVYWRERRGIMVVAHPDNFLRIGVVDCLSFGRCGVACWGCRRCEYKRKSGPRFGSSVLGGRWGDRHAEAQAVRRK